MAAQYNEQAVSDFKESLARRIRALLPGAVLSGPFQGGISHDLFVCYNTVHQLRIYTPPELNNFFVFERSIPFTEDERVFLDRVIRGAFADVLGGAGSIDESMAKSIAGAVSAYVAPDCPETALGIISLYESWSKHPHSDLTHTTGITMARKKNIQGNFFEIARQDIVKSLGSSPDTLLIIDADGGIHGLEKIPPTGDSAGRQEILSPDVHANLAVWANSRRKVAVRLTEDGTILLFSRGRLLFFKQDACWLTLPHTFINAGFCTEGVEGVEPKTLKAVYLTALDLAVGKTSSRIALVLFSQGKNIAAKLRKAGWRHTSRTASKAINLLSVLVNTRKFYEIPRTIRSEICSMGGTLLLDGEGNILGLDPFVNNTCKAEAANDASSGFFPGRGYMELLNDSHKSNLHLTIY